MLWVDNYVPFTFIELTICAIDALRYVFNLLTFHKCACLPVLTMSNSRRTPPGVCAKFAYWTIMSVIDYFYTNSVQY